MNGKNENGIAVPYVFEFLALIATGLCLWYYQKATSTTNPIATAKVTDLLMRDENNTAAVRNHAEYPEFLGTYVDEIAKQRYGWENTEANDFTLLDEDFLNGLKSGCIGSDQSADECNTITFGAKCVCVGANPDFATCLGTSDSEENARCAKHSGLKNYIDVRDLATKLPTSDITNCYYVMLLSAFLMSFSRLVARIGYPQELKKPGAMWVNGWPAGILCLVASCGAFKMYASWDNQTGPQYFSRHDYMFGYQPGFKLPDFAQYDNSGAWDSLYWSGIASGVLNIFNSFFSDHAYCNDITTLAYTKANLKRVRDKQNKAN